METYVYIDHWPETEEYDAEIEIVPLKDDFFSYWMSNCDLDDEQKKEFSHLSTGYYKIHISTEEEHEYVDGYPSYSYLVYAGLIDAFPDRFYGRWLWFKTKWSLRFSNFVDLFRKCWRVEVEYGGIGYTGKQKFLPHAYFDLAFKRDLAFLWGREGVTDSRVVKRY